MENVWMVATFILLFILFVFILYHIYYRKNVRHITEELTEILRNPDTNQLLTIVASQKDITVLVEKLNTLIKDTRSSRIHIKRMNRSFRQSITNISHDVRTPLTTASGYLQMLQTNVSDEERKEYLAIVLERQHMVQTLLNQLFEYVRLESGEITYEQVSIDAKKVFIDTLTMYYDDFNRKAQEPMIHLPDSPCVILGNEQGLKRIFSNILMNALLHGHGNHIFEIKESGNGFDFLFSNVSEPMTTEELESIFDRSYTKDTSRNKKTTGLGLTIAKEIVKQLNGIIAAGYENGRFEIRVRFEKNE